MCFLECVHEDAGELVADGLVDERGSHGGIDAAGEAYLYTLRVSLHLYP